MKNTLQTLSAKAGLPFELLEARGQDSAKIPLSILENKPGSKGSKLILVTAMSPTPAGEGKTTTAIGLNDGLRLIGKNSIACLRQPSLGPVFGQKGGATGGGKSQLTPAEDINLGFNGDFSAIESANNLLAALIDNHLHQGNSLQIDPHTITWRRVLDMNDRALRSVVSGLGKGNGGARETGFDITAASEIMAILCLAESFADLKTRIDRIVIGYTFSGKSVTASDLGATGAMTALLRHAIKPNLVQSLEGNPVLVHGGPFANIAHGCSSVIATKMALRFSDYVVTECGFGADLGAEKFLHIKCRQAGLWPDAAVCVATVRALKYHGGVKVAELNKENTDKLKLGLSNLKRHVENLKSFGLPVIVSVNRFPTDTDSELSLLKELASSWGVSVVVSNPFGEGGKGCEELAKTIAKTMDTSESAVPRPLYDREMKLVDKMKQVATKLYGAKEVSISAAARKNLDLWESQGFGHLPICVAKTQYSFSSDSKKLGAPIDHIVEVQSVKLSAGAGFIVMVCGEIMLMPGLPKRPASHDIDCSSDGTVTGL
ncbi:MAG: formate--tetrahydrofolate ligase [Pseudomonadota bacterium]